MNRSYYYILRKLFVFFAVIGVFSCHSKITKDEKGRVIREAKVNGYKFEGRLYPDTDKSEMIRFQYKVSREDNAAVLEYGAETKDHYLNRLYYFSYQAEPDFYIETSYEIIPCAGVIFERNYNLTKDITLALSFPKPKKEMKEITLVYNPIAFNIAPVKLNYSIN